MDGAGEKVGVDPQRADAERLRRKSDILSCRAGKLTLNWIGASFGGKISFASIQF